MRGVRLPAVCWYDVRRSANPAKHYIDRLNSTCSLGCSVQTDSTFNVQPDRHPCINQHHQLLPKRNHLDHRSYSRSPPDEKLPNTPHPFPNRSGPSPPQHPHNDLRYNINEPLQRIRSLSNALDSRIPLYRS